MKDSLNRPMILRSRWDRLNGTLAVPGSSTRGYCRRSLRDRGDSCRCRLVFTGAGKQLLPGEKRRQSRTHSTSDPGSRRLVFAGGTLPELPTSLAAGMIRQACRAQPGLRKGFNLPNKTSNRTASLCAA